VAPLQVRDHALVVGVVGALAAVAVLELDPHPVDALAVEHRLALLRRQRAEGGVHVDAHLLGHRHHQPLEVALVAAGPGGDRPVLQAEVGVGHDQLGVDLEAGAQPVAHLAGPVGRVEREVAGRQLLEAAVAVGAGEVLRERQRLRAAVVLVLAAAVALLAAGHPVGAVAVPGHDLHLGHAVGQLERRLQRVGQPALDAVSPHEAVDDHLDGVLLVAGQLDPFGRLPHLAVDPGAGEALGREVGQQGLIGALAAAHHRSQHLEPGAVGQLHDAVDDLLRGLPGDLGATLRAVGHADAGEQQAQVVVDLGDGADGGARVAGRALLVDGDGRREPLDEVDVGLVHLAQELAGIGRQRLDVPALALGVDGVERQRRLARAREPGEHDQLLPRQLEADVAQVVLSGTPDDQRVSHGAPG
jgi:hypothetical protein